MGTQTRLLATLLCLFSSASVMAQTAGTPISGTPATGTQKSPQTKRAKPPKVEPVKSDPKPTLAAPDSGPTMEQTKGWFEGDMAGLARNSYTDLRYSGGVTLRTAQSVGLRNINLDNCVLSYTSDWQASMSSDHFGPDVVKQTSSHSVPMKELEPNSFVVEENLPLSPSVKRDATAYDFLFKLRTGGAIRITTVTNNGSTVSEDFGKIEVASQSDGERIKKAFSRAAQLCGAHASVF